MPSIQKIVLALALATTAFAAQISDGQLQQATSTPVIVPVIKQITDGQLQQVTSTAAAIVTPAALNQINDGQIQQVTSTPAAIVTPAALKQISDGQIQQVSASIVPSSTSNATTVTTASPTAATFTGAASLMTYSMELVIGAVAVLAML